MATARTKPTAKEQRERRITVSLLLYFEIRAVGLARLSCVAPVQPFAELLEGIRRSAAAAQSLDLLQKETTQAIAGALPDYNWVGFYMLDPHDPEMLVLGPFVGEPTPHVRIPIHQGICGSAVALGETIIVDDVDADPRYLSCSIRTRSEIVTPIWVDGKVVGELDIDSHTTAAFTDADRSFLEQVAEIVGGFISRGAPSHAGNPAALSQR
jgi:L-methionine (R)-S-oxide reductase